MNKNSDDLLKGTLDVLVLKAVKWGPRHGYSIAQWIRQTSGDALNIEDRALYLALHRLEERGHLSSNWGVSENNRRAKYYRHTKDGTKRLRSETARLEKYVKAMFVVLHAEQWS